MLTRCLQIRLLLARIDAAARAANRRATPLLSLHLDFFRRVYVRIDDASASSHAPSSTASDQPPLVTVRAIQPTATASACGGAAWEVVHSKQGAARADGSGASADGWEAGPMWSGPLHDEAFAEQCWAQVRERDDAAQSSLTPQPAKRARKDASSAVHHSNKSSEVAGASAPPFRSLPRLRALLRLVAAEASTNKPNNLLLCYEPAGRGNKGALSGAAWKAVVKNLTGKVQTIILLFRSLEAFSFTCFSSYLFNVTQSSYTHQRVFILNYLFHALRFLSIDNGATLGLLGRCVSLRSVSRP